MPIQTSGPIDATDISAEFGGTAPHSLSEYYGAASGIPSSGTINYSDFYGKASTLIPTITYLGGNSGSSSSYSVSSSSSANRLVVSIEGHSSSSIGNASCVINGAAASVIGGAGGPGWEQSAIGYRVISPSDTSISVSWSRPSSVSYVHRVYILENVNSTVPYRTSTGSLTFAPIAAGDIGFISMAIDDSYGLPSASVSGGSFAYDASTTVTNMTYRGGDFIVTNPTSVTVSMSAPNAFDRIWAIWN